VKDREDKVPVDAAMSDNPDEELVRPALLTRAGVPSAVSCEAPAVGRRARLARWAQTLVLA